MWKVSRISCTGDCGEQTPRVGRALPCGLTLRDCLGESERFVFEVNKLLKGIKDLKIVSSKAQNRSNRLLQPKNMSLPPLRELHRGRMGHCQCLPGAVLPTYVALDLYYIYWSILGVPARWRTPPFPLRKNRCALANCSLVTVAVLLLYSLTLSSLDYCTWAYCRQRAMLQPTQKWALWSKAFSNSRLAKYGNVAGKNAEHAGRAWTRSLLLAAATMNFSSDPVLVHHLKPFFSGHRIIIAKLLGITEKIVLLHRGYCTPCIGIYIQCTVSCSQLP